MFLWPEESDRDFISLLGGIYLPSKDIWVIYGLDLFAREEISSL